MKRSMLLLLSLFFAATAHANIASEMDALGANKELLKKARAIDPSNRVRVVQNREVDRYWRLEVGANYGSALGGESYVQTSLLGANVDLHITPRFSIGGRFYHVSNAMTSEGKRQYDLAEEHRKNIDPNYRLPGIDYAKNTWLAVGAWYPIYGKMNLFDMGVAQFDLYFLAGAGQVTLGSGVAPVYTAGGGVGMWLTQHFASRLEVRWQGYEDKPWDGVERSPRAINQAILTATMSFLL